MSNEDSDVRREGVNEDLPERKVTVNMLVGYNMAHFRKVAGLTQEQLGERLGGWTKVAVSAAERSWDGKRVRQFDADEIAAVAQALGVPLAALFLPPEDDMREYRYTITGSTQDEPVTMHELLVTYAMSEPQRGGTPAMRAYEDRFVSAVSKYQGSWIAEAVVTRLEMRATDDQLAAALCRAIEGGESLADMEAAIQDLKDDNTLLRHFLATMLRGTSEGHTYLENIDRQQQRDAWDDMPADRREAQSRFIEIGRELFGERGPATKEEINQVVAETRTKGIRPARAPRTRQRLTDGAYELVQPHGQDRRKKDNS